jgi:hypothetical protein
MGKSYFLLGVSEDHRMVRYFRILLGIACISMAGYWFWFNLVTEKSDFTLWITIVFLLGFGFYQIWSGSGRAKRFIEISNGTLVLKKSSLLPPLKIEAGELEKIEFFPLSIVFFFEKRKKLLLRLGTVHYETNEKIIDELIRFADQSEIRYEVKEEEI